MDLASRGGIGGVPPMLTRCSREVMRAAASALPYLPRRTRPEDNPAWAETTLRGPRLRGVAAAEPPRFIHGTLPTGTPQLYHRSHVSALSDDSDNSYAVGL